VDLDVTQVVKLDADHALVSELTVELEAFAEQGSSLVEVAPQPGPLRQHVQRHSARPGNKIAGEVTGLRCERANALVVALSQSDAAEADQRESFRLPVADGPCGLQRSFVPLS